MQEHHNDPDRHDEYAMRDQETLRDRDAIRIPEAEERLMVDKRETQIGEVGVRKRVESEQVDVPVELRHEEVQVERRDMSDQPIDAAQAQGIFEEGTIRVPVRGEEAVVSKQVVQTGEVVVGKTQQTERQTFSDTVRKERVEIDENYRKARPEFEHHFNERNPGRNFTEAEPHYRAGYEASYDERYAGQRFEDAEPELRRSYQGGSSWDQLRESVREGWKRVRD